MPKYNHEKTISYISIAFFEIFAIIIPASTVFNFLYSFDLYEFIKNHYFIYISFIFISISFFIIAITLYVKRKNFFADLLGILINYLLIIISIILSYTAIYHAVFAIGIRDSIYSSAKIFSTLGTPKIFGKSLYEYSCYRPSIGCLKSVNDNDNKVLATVISESVVSHVISITYFSFVLLGYQRNKTDKAS